MTGGESFSDWLEGFKKEVAATVAAVSPSGLPVSAQARTSFENWWQANQEPIPSGAGDSSALQIDALTAERSELRQQLSQAQAASAADRETLRVQTSKLESHIRALQEQVISLKENKAFLEETFGRAESSKAKLEEELKLERERGLLAAAETVALKHKAAEQEAALTNLREALAAREGTLAELRRQASVYQERLVTAKELTDADVAMLRQELKMFLEEFRIMMSTIRKS